MQLQTFRSKDYRISLISIVICILIPIILFLVSYFELNTILYLSIYPSFAGINILSRLFTRFSIDENGIIIRQLFRNNISIMWDNIEDIQEFTNYHRHFHYIALKQPIKLPQLPYNQNLPRDYRNQAIILNAWEDHARIIELIRAKVPAKPKQQLFVPIAGKSWDKIVPYAIFMIGLGAALLAWSLS